jgi:hypothetical protein
MGKWAARFLGVFVVLLILASAVFWVLEIYPRHDSHPPLRLAKGTLAIQHARIYTAPTEPPIDDGTILIRDGLIAAVGPQVDIPAGTNLAPLRSLRGHRRILECARPFH